MSDLAVTVEGPVGNTAGALVLDVSLSTAGPLVVTGPNGAGKTRLLHMILGVHRPRGGRILVGGRVLFDATAAIDVPPEERRLGYVPQDYALFPHLDGLANVAFGLSALPRRERPLRAREMLAAVGAEHLAARRPGQMSGGERQRVALARALAPSPSALFLDEPLAALDAASRPAVRAFLAELLAARGLPALVVSHDTADAVLAPRVAVLEAGRVTQLGTLAELRAQPATPFAHAFAGA